MSGKDRIRELIRYEFPINNVFRFMITEVLYERNRE